MRGIVPGRAVQSAVIAAKLSIEHISAALRSASSGVAASVAAVVSTSARSAAEVAVVTRWPSTTKCSSDFVAPGCDRERVHVGLEVALVPAVRRAGC